MMSKPADKIIIALDVESLEKARELVTLLRSVVGVFKVGKQLFTRCGPQAITMIHEQGARVFLDLKFHDIPQTVSKAAEEVVRQGVFMFNVHALGGFEMMKATVAAVKTRAQVLQKAPPRIVAVTVLTSMDEADLSAVGITAPIKEHVRQLARLAQAAGVDGVVASPQEIELIKQECGADFLVVTPGVRPAGAQAGDQKRVLSPGEALSKGADYIVIGRPVTEASDPWKAAEEIIKEIER